MDKRFFLAITLSLMVMIGYYTIFPPPPPKAPPAKGQPTTPQPVAKKDIPGAPVTPAAEKPVKAAPVARTPLPEETVKPRKIYVETPLYTATFDNNGAFLRDFRLKNFKVEKANIDWADLIPSLRQWINKEVVDTEARINMARPLKIDMPVFGVQFTGEDALTNYFKRKNFQFDKDSVQIESPQGAAKTLVMRSRDPNGITVVKTFTFHPDSYVVDYDLTVTNNTNAAKTLRVAGLFGEGPGEAAEISQFSSHQGPIWRENDSTSTEDPDDIKGMLLVPKPQWLGLTNTYFITAVRSVETKVNHGFYRSAVVGVNKKTEKDVWGAGFGMEMEQAILQPGARVEGKFQMYFGPRRVADMEKFGGKLETSIHMALGVLGRPMLSLMRWFYSFTGNFGLAIIMLTFVVRMLLFPLTYKGMLSIKRMQKLQPRVAALKEKYKKDKERMNKEMMGLYKKHKMNPLGGCLPIALQIPIFFALYIALSGAIELRHEPLVFWIVDLSAHDGLYVTPVLMGISMLMQQKLSPTSLDPTQAKIMMMMPIVFSFFMLGFPAGLVVYWLTSNILSICQQLVINRIKVPEPTD